MQKVELTMDRWWRPVSWVEAASPILLVASKASSQVLPDTLEGHKLSLHVNHEFLTNNYATQSFELQDSLVAIADAATDQPLALFGKYLLPLLLLAPASSYV